MLQQKMTCIAPAGLRTGVMFLIALVHAVSASAQDLRHVSRFGTGADLERANDVVVDADGSIFVVGDFRSSMDLGGGALMSPSDHGGFIARLTPSHDHVWSLGISTDVRNPSDPWSDVTWLTGVSLHTDGNVLVVGEFSGRAVVDGVAFESADGYRDVLAIELDPNGEVVWSDTIGRIPGSGFSKVNDVAVSAGGDIYLAVGTEIWKLGRFGTTEWVLDLSEELEIRDATSLTLSNRDELLVACAGFSTGFDPGVLCIGSGGDIRWQTGFSPGQYCVSIAPTSDGGAIAIGGSAPYAQSSIVRLDSSGGLVWQTILPPEKGFHAVHYFEGPETDVVVDENGDIVVAGGQWWNYEVETPAMARREVVQTRFVMRKYTSQGREMWEQIFVESGYYQADFWSGGNGVTLAPDGSIVVAGRIGTGGVTLDGEAISGLGHALVATIETGEASTPEVGWPPYDPPRIAIKVEASEPIADLEVFFYQDPSSPVQAQRVGEFFVFSDNSWSATDGRDLRITVMSEGKFLVNWVNLKKPASGVPVDAILQIHNDAVGRAMRTIEGDPSRPDGPRDPDWDFYGPDEVPTTLLVPPDGRADSVDPASRRAVFVHGVDSWYGGWGTVPAVAESGLEVDGYSVDCWMVSYPKDQRIGDSATLLGRALDRIALGADLGAPYRAESDVVLVAWSMGGLVSRSMLDRDTRDVTRLMMIATPNHGSRAAFRLARGEQLPAAVAWFLGKDPDAPAYAQMTPGSRFLVDELNASPLPPLRSDPAFGNGYLVVTGVTTTAYDDFQMEVRRQGDGVVSVSSASLLGRGVPLAVMVGGSAGHTKIWSSAEIVDVVVPFLADAPISEVLAADVVALRTALSYSDDIQSWEGVDTDVGVVTIDFGGIGELRSDWRFTLAEAPRPAMLFEGQSPPAVLSGFDEPRWYVLSGANGEGVFHRVDCGSSLLCGTHPTGGAQFQMGFPNPPSGFGSPNPPSTSYSIPVYLARTDVPVTVGPVWLSARAMASVHNPIELPESSALALTSSNYLDLVESNPAGSTMFQFDSDAEIDAVVVGLTGELEAPSRKASISFIDRLAIAKPGGVVIEAADADGTQGVEFVAADEAELGQFVLSDPTPGMWGVLVRDGDSEVAVAAVVQSNISSSLAIDESLIVEDGAVVARLEATGIAGVGPANVTAPVRFRAPGGADELAAGYAEVQQVGPATWLLSVRPTAAGEYVIEARMSIDLGGGTVIERISSASRLVSDEDPLSIDGDGEGESPPQLGRFGISAVSPNPFNPAVNVEFAVERSALVVLEVFALDGRRVKTLVSETLPAGRHEVTWGGVDSDGVGVASGVYLFRMRAEGKVYIGRGTLLK